MPYRASFEADGLNGFFSKHIKTKVRIVDLRYLGPKKSILQKRANNGGGKRA